MDIKLNVDDKEFEDHVLALTMRILNFYTKYNEHRTNLLFKMFDKVIDDFGWGKFKS